MPIIFFYGPKMEKEKRKELIKSFTEATSRLAGVDQRAVIVQLTETDPAYVGIGGELLEERQQRQRKP